MQHFNSNYRRLNMPKPLTDLKINNEHLLEDVTENSISPTKSDDMMLLDRQGRCSQQLRSSLQQNMSGDSESSTYPSSAPCVVGNLKTISQTIGRNMTDISHFEYGGSKDVSVFPDTICSMGLNNTDVINVGNSRKGRQLLEVSLMHDHNK